MRRLDGELSTLTDDVPRKTLTVASESLARCKTVKHSVGVSDQMVLVTAGKSVRPQRGTATVELALVIPLLIFLLFSIIELGFLVKNRTELGQAAREGARLAAVGGTMARVDAGVHAALQSIRTETLDHSCDSRIWDESAENWADWEPMATEGDGNNAPRGAQIRVRLEYQHQLLVPGLMGPVLSANEHGEVRLSASSVMMRE